MNAHTYPCPRGPALPWLLRHLVQVHSPLAKDLAAEILERNLPIPLENRTRLVGELAAVGHGVIARGLWSRWSVGRDRGRFIASPALMIRMVSLFNHLRHKEEEVLEERDGKGPFPDEQLIRDKIEDYGGFINLVMAEFSRAHHPISAAHHRTLTSYARALFIIGDFTKGTAMIQILLGRQEMPDLYDVNVTLTGHR
ncbi:hypothetical protein FB45DRAFT_291841 [Roridomyces roridus]|uniref:Uncharacterized protein n=1 Tax=Roridomyces roridus TaxID=1738132 RepID=A0AAD7CB82_9AGAR|nr:hypothetical protein FB45DRAFT_291841 [Roridomyces roridus]